MEKIATLAGGCFWCLQAPYEGKPGIIKVVAGYAGGQVQNPSYEDVVQGDTGHREAVQVHYDPEQISFQQILDIFWLQIDPTDPEGQFADRGFQYTTAIYHHDDEQEQVAEESKLALEESGRYQSPIATQIELFTNFYPAEEHHQQYYLKNPQAYKQYHQGSGRAAFIAQNKQKLA
jgi:methionine-S-sulfoxide reductase